MGCLTQIQPAYDQEFIGFMITQLQTICGDSWKRKQSCLKTNIGDRNINAGILRSGIWSGTDLFNALIKLNHKMTPTQPLLDWFVDANIGYHHSLPNKFFSHIETPDSPTKVHRTAFRIMIDVLPSEALLAIDKRFVVLESGMARWVGVYRAIENFLGTEKFNHLFSRDSPNPLRISNDHLNPAACLFEEITVNSEAAIRKGDLCSFSNIEDYIYKHPLGTSKEIHVICVDAVAKKYVGLGLQSEGVSSEGVESFLLEEYNSTPNESLFKSKIWQHVFSSSLVGNELIHSITITKKVMNALKDDTSTSDEFIQSKPFLFSPRKKGEGKLFPIVLRPQANRLKDLQEATIDNIREVFKRFVVHYDTDASVAQLPGSVELF